MATTKKKARKKTGKKRASSKKRTTKKRTTKKRAKKATPKRAKKARKKTGKKRAKKVGTTMTEFDKGFKAGMTEGMRLGSRPAGPTGGPRIPRPKPATPRAKKAKKRVAKQAETVSAASILKGAKQQKAAMQFWVCAGKNRTGCGGGVAGGHVVTKKGAFKRLRP